MKFIIDDSHAWLEVSLSEYPNAIEFGTGFGYLDSSNELIYLEEDSEAYKFCEWLFNGHVDKAREIEELVVHGRSEIRNLPNNKAILKT
jgi:hypothetical protein